ncbi:MAG: hypothetical protein IID45_02520, partial [Planctomycetes bacterium]|nr:hypothetical protein [Planctomycetota bacterium]
MHSLPIHDVPIHDVPIHDVRSASLALRTFRSSLLLLLPVALLLLFATPTAAKKTATAASPNKVKTTATKKVKKRVVVPIEQRPYRVRVSVAFPRDPDISPYFRRRLLDGLAAAIDRSYGKMWSAEIRENRWISTAGQLGLDRLSAAKLVKRFRDEKMADG